MDNKPTIEASLQYDSGQSGWTKHEVAVVAIRLLAAYLAAQAIPYIGQVLFAGFVQTDRRIAVFLLANLIAYAAPAIFLFIKAEDLTPRLLPSEPKAPQGLERAPNTIDLQSLAFSVIAILMIVWGLPGVMQVLYDWAHRGTPQPWGHLDAIVLIVGGIALFLRARGLSVLWHKIRTGGTVGRR